MKNIVIFCIAIFLFSSCQKEAGEGGTSVIEGKVFKKFTFADPNTGQDSLLYYQEYSGEDVFVIYSNDASQMYDDKFETDWQGRYRFEYLRKGDYVVYIEADSTDGSGIEHKYPIFKSISIKSNNSIVSVDDFVIEKNQ
tara:strand:- start:279 stop:695 length:417 start_codon:yes stop_codon:yes gene_type:complete